MHELSIALSIIEIVEQEIETRGMSRLTAVHIKVGALSGIVKDALLASYEAACEQTPLAGSQLIVQEIPVMMKCPQCGDRREVDSIHLLCCATCGTPAKEIVQGRELLVTGLEVLE